MDLKFCMQTSHPLALASVTVAGVSFSDVTPALKCDTAHGDAANPGTYFEDRITWCARRRRAPSTFGRSSHAVPVGSAERHARRERRLPVGVRPAGLRAARRELAQRLAPHGRDAAAAHRPGRVRRRGAAVRAAAAVLAAAVAPAADAAVLRALALARAARRAHARVDRAAARAHRAALARAPQQLVARAHVEVALARGGAAARARARAAVVAALAVARPARLARALVRRGAAREASAALVAYAPERGERGNARGERERAREGER